MLSYNVITFIYNFVHVAFRIYYFLVIANIILSWFPMRRGNVIVTFIYEMTEPFLRIFRRILPPSPRFPVDFSPMLAIFALYIMEVLVFKLLSILLF